MLQNISRYSVVFFGKEKGEYGILKPFHFYEIFIYEIEGSFISNIVKLSSDAPLPAETQYTSRNDDEKYILDKAVSALKSLDELRGLKCDSNYPNHPIR